MITVVEKVWTPTARNVIKETTSFHSEKEAKDFLLKRTIFYDNNKLWSFTSDKDGLRIYDSFDKKKICWLFTKQE